MRFMKNKKVNELNSCNDFLISKKKKMITLWKIKKFFYYRLL